MLGFLLSSSEQRNRFHPDSESFDLFRKEGFLKSKTYEASDEARASFLAESRAEGLVSFLPNPEDEATEIENMRFDTLPSPKQHRWLYSMV